MVVFPLLTGFWSHTARRRSADLYAENADLPFGHHISTPQPSDPLKSHPRPPRASLWVCSIINAHLGHPILLLHHVARRSAGHRDSHNQKVINWLLVHAACMQQGRHPFLAAFFPV